MPTTASTEIVAQQGQPPPARPGRGEGQGERPQLTDAQRQEMQQQREAAEQQYIDSLAKNLGVSSDMLKSALEQTRKDMQAQRVTEIQQAVADGKLTQEQADQKIQRMQEGPGGPGGMGGPGFGPGGMRGGPGGPNGGQGGGECRQSDRERDLSPASLTRVRHPHSRRSARASHLRTSPPWAPSACGGIPTAPPRTPGEGLSVSEAAWTLAAAHAGQRDASNKIPLQE